MNDLKQASKELRDFQNNQEQLKRLGVEINRIEGRKQELNKQLKAHGFKTPREASDWEKTAGEEIGELSGKIKAGNNDVEERIEELKGILG